MVGNYSMLGHTSAPILRASTSWHSSQESVAFNLEPISVQVLMKEAYSDLTGSTTTTTLLFGARLPKSYIAAKSSFALSYVGRRIYYYTTDLTCDFRDHHPCFRVLFVNFFLGLIIYSVSFLNASSRIQESIASVLTHMLIRVESAFYSHMEKKKGCSTNFLYILNHNVA